MFIFLFCVLADDNIDMASTYLKVSEERMHCLGYGAQKLKTAHPVNYFPGFWGRILRIARPVNYSYLPPCKHQQHKYKYNHDNDTFNLHDHLLIKSHCL